MNESKIATGLKAYCELLNEVKKQYKGKELNRKILRKEHKELKFMDNEEIDTLIESVEKLNKKEGVSKC